MLGLIYLLIVVLMLVSMWKIFEKAGRQGWEGIIPIYNVLRDASNYQQTVVGGF